MRQPVEYYFDYFANFYLSIYPVFILLILAGTIILKEKYKAESYNLLYVFNTTAAWASFFIVLYFIIEFFVAWYGQNPYEWYSFRTMRQSNPYSFIYIKMYMAPLLGLIFFFRRLRRSRFFTIVFSLCLTIGLVEHLLPAFRDYLPTSWSTYYFESFTDKAIKYAVVIFFLVIIYLVAKKRNKLPYPSVFLK